MRILVPLLLAACEAVRPSAPDVGPDASQPDVPTAPDAGACPAFAGLYVGTTSCPGLATGAFAACVGQDGCEGTLHLASASSSSRFLLDGTRGDFTDGSLPAGVTCQRAEASSDALRLACVDRFDIGCTLTLVRRDFDADGVCCTDSTVCAEGAGCTLLAVGGGLPETTACVERAEPTRALGEPCMRTAPGADDCARGAFCTTLGSTDGALACRALCRGAGDCTTAEVCAAAGTAPRMGTCIPGCDPFDPASCGAGLGCGPTASLEGAGVEAACLDAGIAGLGEPCEASGCVPGLVCARTELLVLRCAAPCDADHPCGSGACVPLAEGGVLGTCQ